jgi:hypothetical protein
LYTIKKIRAIFQFDAWLFAEFIMKNITSVQILAPGVNKSPKELLIWAHLFWRWASVTTVAGLGYSFGT